MREFIKPANEKNLDEEARMLANIDRIIKKKLSSLGSLYNIYRKKKNKFRSTPRK